MSEVTLNPLFSPFSIGAARLKNRICFAAHRTNFANAGHINDRLIAYYQRRAAGGCGLIILGEISIHPQDRPWAKMINTYRPEIVQEYLKLTQTIQQNGTRIFAQLCHHGFQSSGMISRQVTLGPAAVSDIAFGESSKEMELEDMADVKAAFVTAAIQAREGGFDGVGIDLGAESLLRQFLSPIGNFRQDEYGGDLQNRTRFPLEVIQAVRHEVGQDFIVGARLCVDEFFPGGLTSQDAVEIAKTFVQEGSVQFINATVGNYYNLHIMQPSMHTPFGISLEAVALVKETVDVPVIAGHHVDLAASAEEIITANQADAIGSVRPLICDPDLPRKLEKGDFAEIKVCVRDNRGCLGRINQSKPLSCIQNPTVGDEKNEHAHLNKGASDKKRVIVVGSGPAGLEAARTCAMRGHQVTLYEKDSIVGGQVNLARRGVGRERMSEVIRNLERSVRALDIILIMDTEASMEQIIEQQADTVIVATGSQPIEKPLPGEYGLPVVLNVWDVLNEIHPIGERILFIDENGGHHASATVEFLADQGKTIDMITSELFIGMELSATGDLYASRQRLLKKGVTFKTDVRVENINDGTVFARRIYTNEPL
ncbi:MAG: FAD-dependent oxidoreductase, partial [SAR324 cluster bacterium]|nr:FAD-dependent oxidoreductase [SAR324 cluster bacterium]